MQKIQITEQNISLLKKEIIQNVFPTECDLIGNLDLNKIINGDVEFKQPKIGSKLNFHEYYLMIAEAVSFLNNYLGIYVNIKALVKKNDPDPKLAKEISTTTTTTIITEADKQIIIEETDRRIKIYG